MAGIMKGRVTVEGPQRSRSAQPDGRKPPANRPSVSFGTMIECGRPNSENASRAGSENGCCWSPVLADRTDGESPIRSSDPVPNTLRRQQKNSKARPIDQQRWQHTIGFR